MHLYELLHKSLSLLETICFFTLVYRKCPIIQIMQNLPLLGSLQSEALILVNLVSRTF